MSSVFGRFSRAIAIVATCLLFISQASALEITHPKGIASFDKVPQRIVVLGHSSLDVLDYLNIQPVGAPHSLLPDYLQHYKNTTKNTGTVLKPDFETIYSLKPDVIIAEARMLRLYDQLNQIAPTIMFTTRHGKYWQDTQSNWRMLGKLLGRETAMESLITSTQQQIDATHRKAAAHNFNALMLMTNGNNLAMYNRESRFSLIFNEFGFAESDSKNVAPIKGAHGNLISFEYVADAHPDVIFVLDRDRAIGRSGDSASQKLDNQLVRSTPAAKNDRLVFINTSAWYLSSGGATATQIMINDINQVLN